MPINGKIRRELSIDSVLSLISEYDIFKTYYPGNFKLNQICISPFPRDKGIEKNPSFIIGNKYGHLSFMDYGDSEKRGDCFNFVKFMVGTNNLNETLEHIDKKMGLGITGGEKKEYKRLISEYKQPEVTKRNTLIQVISRKPNNDELSYWNEYYQDVNDLRNNNVYFIKKLFLNKKLFPIKETELKFGYFYPKGGYWKIYFPFAKNKRYKWIGNVPLSYSWGEENLNKDKNSLVAKSLKDFMLIKKVYPHVVGVQNESLAAFSESFVQNIKNNSKTVYYGGDSDVPGKKTSYEITSAYGFKHINPKDELLPDIKDFAEWGKVYGLDAIKNHFLSKGLFD